MKVPHKDRNDTNFYGIVAIICAALFPAAIYLLNNGLYWDDWWVYLHKDEPGFPLWLARDQKAPLQLFFMLSDFYFMDNIYVIRIFTLACWVLACLSFAYVLLKNNIASRNESYAIAMLMLSSPVMLGKYVLIVYGCTLTLSLFWAAFALMVRKNCLRNRVVAYILFFISFGFKSLLFFYAIFLLYLLKKEVITFSFGELTTDVRGTLKHIWIAFVSFVKKNYIFVLLPILNVIFCEVIKNRPIERYVGYNEIKLNEVFFAIAETVINISTLLASFPYYLVTLFKFGFFYVLFFFCLFLIIFFFLHHKINFSIALNESKQSFSQILTGIVLLFFGTYPYVLVGHQVTFSGSFAMERHLSVAHFGLILALFGVFKLLFSFFKPSKKAVIFAFSTIIALNTSIACMIGMHYCRDAVIQGGIINDLACNSEYVKQFNVILFKDDAQRTLIRDPVPLCDYEFMGYLDKSGIRSRNIYSCSVYRINDFDRLHWKNEIKFLALQKLDMINVKPLHITVSLKQHLTLWKSLWITCLYYTNKTKYAAECSKYISLSYTPLYNKVTDSMQELKLFSEKIEYYKQTNGHYPFTPAEKATNIFYIQTSPSYSVVEQKTWSSTIPWPTDSYPSVSGYDYFSDGENYKLIAHKPLDAIYSRISYPENYDTKHNSYGYWSDGAKNW